MATLSSLLRSRVIPFAGVQGKKHVEIGRLAVRRRAAPATGVVAAAWALDLSDSRAEVAQHHGGMGNSQGLGQVDHDDDFQRPTSWSIGGTPWSLLIPLTSSPRPVLSNIDHDRDHAAEVTRHSKAPEAHGGSSTCSYGHGLGKRPRFTVTQRSATISVHGMHARVSTMTMTQITKTRSSTPNLDHQGRGVCAMGAAFGLSLTRSAFRAYTTPRSQACLRHTGTGRPGRSAPVWTSMQRSRNVAVSRILYTQTPGVLAPMSGESHDCLHTARSARKCGVLFAPV